ncbi:MAG: hypothetical protein ACYDBH_06220 [Acidobacteriaceae bacterium]
MTPQAALQELLERVGAGHGTAALVSDYELGQWPNAAVSAMVAQGLLTPARPAVSALCPGCERECVMPVHTLPQATRHPEAFIVCDKRHDINRVAVPIGQLTQRQCTVPAICGFVADSLALRRSDKRSSTAGHWDIGLVTGARRSQMLSLKADGVLVLVAGNNAVPLAECIRYHNGTFSMDGTLIRQLVDAATTSDHRYTPSNARREARKLDTQAMYDRWRKEYRALKKTRPNLSDVWYAQQIAKKPIAQGRDAETIRKHMKK